MFYWTIIPFFSLVCNMPLLSTTFSYILVILLGCLQFSIVDAVWVKVVLSSPLSKILLYILKSHLSRLTKENSQWGTIQWKDSGASMQGMSRVSRDAFPSRRLCTVVKTELGILPSMVRASWKIHRVVNCHKGTISALPDAYREGTCTISRPDSTFWFLILPLPDYMFILRAITSCSEISTFSTADPLGFICPPLSLDGTPALELGTWVFPQLWDAQRHPSPGSQGFHWNSPGF